MRKATISLTILFGVICLLGSATTARADQWTKTWTVSGTAHVHLATGRGSIELRQVPGNSIRALVTTSDWRISPLEVQITESQTGNNIDIHIHTPEVHNFFFFHWHSPSAQIEIELDVPARSDLTLETGFGDVSGDGIQAHLRINTGFGKVRLPEFDGSLDAQSGFGDLTTDGRFDSLDLKTGFGHINAGVVSGSKLSDSWTLSSGFGDVVLRMAQGLNADLRASTGFGHVSSDYPITISGSISHSSVNGQLGAGGPVLDVDTGFGSVHISRM